MSDPDDTLEATLARVHAIRDLLGQMRPRKGIVFLSELGQFWKSADRWRAKLEDELSKSPAAKEAGR